MKHSIWHTNQTENWLLSCSCISAQNKCSRSSMLQSRMQNTVNISISGRASICI